MNRPRPEVVTLGRASVDLYGEQVGGRLEDMQSFAKYVGGCPTNIAIGCARLGLGSAVITGVGDEQMGRFIVETLRAERVDASQVKVDPQRLTALVILGIRDGATMPHIFYRENCADMGLEPDDIDEDFVAEAGVLVVTGTHLSASGVAAATSRAVAAARRGGARVVFDIDYRPVLWGLSGHGEGAARYAASAAVSDRMQDILPACDLVVGTEEEIRIAGGSDDTAAALRAIRARSKAVILVKRGAAGCTLYSEGCGPDDGLEVPGFPVEVFNTLGAGDGFMAGFLRGWARGEPLETCARWGNACGALVVSRHGCAPAIPSWTELQDFLDRPPATPRLREDKRLEELHRVTTRRRHWPELLALAFDHRVQLEQAADRAGVPRARIRDLKSLILDGALRAMDGQPGAGAILDRRYGESLLPRLTGRGWWVARSIEAPGTRPLDFDEGPDPALTLRHWPEEQVAKCLVLYHPDDPAELRARQEGWLRALQRACRGTGHELLVEVLPPGGMPVGEGVLPRALDALYAADVRPDWWKLPSAPPAVWRELSGILERHDPHCRGMLLLGLEAPESGIEAAFAAVAELPWCKGFAIGRSVFAGVAEDWLTGRAGDDEVIDRVAEGYGRLVELWRRHRGAASDAA